MNRTAAILLPWHRRAGVVAALFVLILSVSGLLLNHTEDLKLDEIYINNSLILKLYGLEAEAPQIIGYTVDDQWVVQWNGTVFYNDHPVKRCDELVGAGKYSDQLMVACSDELFLLDRNGLLVEQVGSSLGLPTPVDYLGLGDGRLSIISDSSIYEFDLERLRFVKAQGREARRIQSADIPSSLLAKIEAQVVPDHSIHLERILLDIHSGRIFGKAGPWVFDVAALLLIFLSLSGFYVWSKSARGF